jgi:hypothetical protein
MPQKFNSALVGLGVGDEFIPIYQAHPNARLIAVCQRGPEKPKSSSRTLTTPCASTPGGGKTVKLPAFPL